jgi:hypothetical protein
MYSKEALKQLKIDFWTGFKNHMSKVRSSSGKRINWINYPSEIDFVFIRVDTDGKGARFMIDIQAKDEGVRAIMWEQLYELKAVLTAEMGDEGLWLENTFNAHIPAFNRIIWEREDLSFYRSEDHPAIMAFLEDRLVRFDAFYQEFKEILINLAS